MMVVFTVLTAALIAAGQFFANRVGLGAPLIDGRLSGREAIVRRRKVILVAVLFAVIASPVLVIYNRHLGLGTVEQLELWRLVLAAVDAGIQEEIFSRLFLMSLFAWVWWWLQGAREDTPKPLAFWIVILLSASLFAWDHVDGHLMNLSQNRIMEVLALTGALGVGFGWCYWRLGLECAILAHILVDAIGFVLVNAVYFPANSFVLPSIVVGLLSAGIVCARALLKGD